MSNSHTPILPRMQWVGNMAPNSTKSTEACLPNTNWLPDVSKKHLCLDFPAFMELFILWSFLSAPSDVSQQFTEFKWGAGADLQSVCTEMALGQLPSCGMLCEQSRYNYSQIWPQSIFYPYLSIFCCKGKDKIGIVLGFLQDKKSPGQRAYPQ